METGKLLVVQRQAQREMYHKWQQAIKKLLDWCNYLESGSGRRNDGIIRCLSERGSAKINPRHTLSHTATQAQLVKEQAQAQRTSERRPIPVPLPTRTLPLFFLFFARNPISEHHAKHRRERVWRDRESVVRYILSPFHRRPR